MIMMIKLRYDDCDGADNDCCAEQRQLHPIDKNIYGGDEGWSVGRSVGH